MLTLSVLCAISRATKKANGYKSHFMEQQKYQQSRSFSPFALLNKKQSARERDSFPCFPSFLFSSFSTVRRRFCVKSFSLKGSWYTNNCTLPSETDKQQSSRGKRCESVTESTKWEVSSVFVTKSYEVFKTKFLRRNDMCQNKEIVARDVSWEGSRRGDESLEKFHTEWERHSSHRNMKWKSSRARGDHAVLSWQTVFSFASAIIKIVKVLTFVSHYTRTRTNVYSFYVGVI